MPCRSRSFVRNENKRLFKPLDLRTSFCVLDGVYGNRRPTTMVSIEKSARCPTIWHRVHGTGFPTAPL